MATAAGMVLISALFAVVAPVPPGTSPREAGASEHHDGLTVVDLSDDWVPTPFVDDPSLGGAGRVEYRPTFVALANEDLDEGEGADWRRARRDRFFELYGVFPSLAVVRGRLLDEERHRCHDNVNGIDLFSVMDDVRNGKSASRKALRAAQQHLVCEGFLDAGDVGASAGETKLALKLYQRRNMLLATGKLDVDTARAMIEGSRELDYRTLLRVLRERTADAAGLIEDGSASGRYGRVFDRELDAPEFRHFGGDGGLPNGAPDLISPATEAAARSLGWTSPQAAIAWFRARPADATRHMRIAVQLPPTPSYHSRSMDLRAEIDRADDEVGQRPSLVLYANTDEGEIALMRWPTTIGGWQQERLDDGSIAKRFKESPLGPRLWRQLIVGPAWFPPESTPPDELVTSSGRLQSESIGPGYASAYGLIMLMHERDLADGDSDGSDTGIRTHGSVNVMSITRGNSHGCHRLFNHLAVRLGSFLLQHRPHERRGPMTVDYELSVHWEGKTLRLHRTARGYLWELTPPVPVEVVANRTGA